MTPATSLGPRTIYLRLIELQLFGAGQTTTILRPASSLARRRQTGRGIDAHLVPFIILTKNYYGDLPHVSSRQRWGRNSTSLPVCGLVRVSPQLAEQFDRFNSAYRVPCSMGTGGVSTICYLTQTKKHV